MSKNANYEAEAKGNLYDIAEKIANRYKEFTDDGRLMDPDCYTIIAPCLNYLSRLMDEYNSMLGSNAVKLSFADLFGESLAEEFRHYREDCGIVVDGEDSESFLPFSERFPVTSNDDEYWDAQEEGLSRTDLVVRRVTHAIDQVSFIFRKLRCKVRISVSIKNARKSRKNDTFPI